MGSKSREQTDELANHNYIALLDNTETGGHDTAQSPSDDMYGATLSAEFPDVKKQDTARDVAELRATFKSGFTKELANRRMLLQQLQRLITEGENAMREAMWKDLHKHPLESFMTELSPVIREVQDHLDYLSDWAKPERVPTDIANLPGLSYIVREPLGVVCVIGTWNYPANLLFTPLVSALAAGNCVVLRLPGDDTTRYLNNVFISLIDKYLDRRVVRYVYGGVEETKMMLRERYDLIFATGGCFLGKIVARAAAEHLTPTVLELGGKSPAIIDETTDLAIAARRICWGAFTNAGQTCVRPDYILVDERIGDRFVKALEQQIMTFYGTDPQKCEGYGRVINRRMFDRLTKTLHADAARVTFGGIHDEKELYIAPTLMNFKGDFEAFKSSAVMQEESFGPLLPIYYYPAGDLQWPIDYIHTFEKPLALYLFSTNTKNKERVVRETSSGSMVINDCMMQLANAHLPFGGVGNSGMGAYHGRHGFEAFSHRKSVLYKYSLLDLAQRYVPYTKSSERIMRLVLRPIPRKYFTMLKVLFFAAVVAAIGAGIRGAIKK